MKFLTIIRWKCKKKKSKSTLSIVWSIATYWGVEYQFFKQEYTMFWKSVSKILTWILIWAWILTTGTSRKIYNYSKYKAGAHCIHGPVDWGCRIHWLHLCRWVRLPKKCPGYDTKLSDGDAGALGNVEYPFIAITPRSTLAWSDSTW